MPENKLPIKILLADDDKDDIDLFRDALNEISLSTDLALVSNGDILMKYLCDPKKPFPDILFLDLNMPKKNGFKCLSEIKADQQLYGLPVIIFSTSNEPQLINELYQTGARYYIRKPNSFGQLKKLVHQALIISTQASIGQPAREEFVLS